ANNLDILNKRNERKTGNQLHINPTKTVSRYFPIPSSLNPPNHCLNRISTLLPFQIVKLPLFLLGKLQCTLPAFPLTLLSRLDTSQNIITSLSLLDFLSASDIVDCHNFISLWHADR